MNKQIFEGKWKQFHGNAKQWRDKLTDDDRSSNQPEE